MYVCVRVCACVRSCFGSGLGAASAMMVPTPCRPEVSTALYPALQNLGVHGFRSGFRGPCEIGAKQRFKTKPWVYTVFANGMAGSRDGSRPGFPLGSRDGFPLGSRAQPET